MGVGVEGTADSVILLYVHKNVIPLVAVSHSHDWCDISDSLQASVCMSVAML